MAIYNDMITKLLPVVVTLLCGVGLLVELVMFVEFIHVLRAGKASDEEGPKP